MHGGCGDGAGVHKERGVCTGELDAGVEEVGKNGQVLLPGGEFCNCPETGGRDLERLARSKVRRVNQVGENPLFLRELR